jgi:glyoxylase-like metal-dependent hydrolase (beta-lactamase superfamily II)
MEQSRSTYEQVAPHVWRIRDIFVNLYIVQNPSNKQFVLIDAGLKTAGKKVKNAIFDLFGPGKYPSAILLTHGHFDHIGSLKDFIHEWNVPVYAHPLEAPYLTGQSDYPPPDPTVGGGLMAALSWMYPKKPIDIKDHLKLLPDNGSVPILDEWKYIYTPGHAPGHVSFFREQDRLLIAGDALVTTKQESALFVMLQKKWLSGPPKYFTYDWKASKESVKQLNELNPAIMATGHGEPLSGEQMKKELQNLLVHFDQLAIPKQGRYVNEPAVVTEKGVVYLPPPKISIFLIIILLVIITLILFIILR